MSDLVSLAVRNYGLGRICIICDRIGGHNTGHGDNSLFFWSNLINWVSSKGNTEQIKIGVIQSFESNYENTLSNINNVEFKKIELINISSDYISSFDLLYFIGLPNAVSPDVSNKLMYFIEQGGGLLIENPNRGGENINVLNLIDNVYCSSIQRPTLNKAQWTITGVNHPIYTNDVVFNFMSTLEKSSFSDEWDVLMDNNGFNIEQEIISSEIQTPQILLSTLGSEFCISFTTGLKNGIANVNNSGVMTNFISHSRKIISAIQPINAIGTFISYPIYIPTLIRWESILWNGNSVNENLAFFVRNANAEILLNSSPWIGPYYNNKFNISQLSSKYLQIMAVLTSNNLDNTYISDININFITENSESIFFTKTFDLGFSPKDILLTYNADENTDSLIKFAVTASDTVDSNYYQFIEPNKLEKLNLFSPLADKIKLMIKMIDNSSNGIKTQLHEFSFMVGGDKEKLIK